MGKRNTTKDTPGIPGAVSSRQSSGNKSKKKVKAPRGDRWHGFTDVLFSTGRTATLVPSDHHTRSHEQDYSNDEFELLEDPVGPEHGGGARGTDYDGHHPQSLSDQQTHDVHDLESQYHGGSHFSTHQEGFHPENMGFDKYTHSSHQHEAYYGHSQLSNQYLYGGQNVHQGP
jgi:hypothetical protein